MRTTDYDFAGYSGRLAVHVEGRRGVGRERLAPLMAQDTYL